MQRIGRRNDPSYRIVVVNSTTGPKSNKYIEKVGFHDSIRKTSNFEKDRILYWMSEGAKTSDTVHNLLIKNKIIEGTKVNALPRKTPIVKEATEEDKEKVEEVKVTPEEDKDKKEEVIGTPEENEVAPGDNVTKDEEKVLEEQKDEVVSEKKETHSET